MLDPIADLRARFQVRTIERVAALRAAIERIAADPCAAAQIVDLAHQLAGSAGTFGHTALSQAAAKLEASARQRCRSPASADKEMLEQPFSEIEACTSILASSSRPSIA